MSKLDDLKALVDTHDGLHHTLANAVYDTIPWRGVNNPTAEAQNDYLYDKCISAVEAVLDDARPAIALALKIVEAAKAVSDMTSADNVARVSEMNLNEMIADSERRWHALHALLAELDAQ